MTNNQLQILKDSILSFVKGKVVFMGIGNILRGDDGIGPELVARLSGKDLCTVDAGTAPENYIRPVARLEPDTVVIIDAVSMDSEPGAVELLQRTEIMGNTGFTTHSLSPVMVMERLEKETGAIVVMLAIQPGTLEFGAPLSPEVARLLDILPDLLTLE